MSYLYALFVDIDSFGGSNDSAAALAEMRSCGSGKDGSNKAML
jgi:hypothetical protein